MELRPYQIEARKAVRDREAAGVRAMATVLPTGTGKCVRGDTLVMSAEGMQRIDGFCASRVPGSVATMGSTVYGISGPEPAAYWYYDGVRSTVRITTRCGYSLEGTPNHRVLVMGAEGVVQWRALGELQVGDAALLARGAGVWPAGEVPIPLEAAVYHTCAHRLTLPLMVGRDFAELMGWLSADGTLSVPPRISFTKGDEDARTRVMALFAALGLRSTEIHQRGKTAEVVVSSAPLRGVFAALGMPLATTPHKQVPGCILRSPRHVVVAFLRGLFSGDASVFPDRSLVEYTTASSVMARQVQTLLLSLGVPARLRLKHVRGYGEYSVVGIGGAAVRVFAREIGFVCARKQEPLAAITAKATNTNIDVVPHAAPLLQGLHRAYRARFRALPDGYRKMWSSYECGLRQPSYTMLGDILGAYARIADEPEYQALRRVVTRMPFFDPVATIEHDQAADVFDLSVPGTHSFVANGFYNHNTVLFASEITDRAPTGRVLVLAHRDELIQQPVETLRRAAPGLEVGICKAERNEVGCKVVVASVQSIVQPARMAKYLSFGRPTLVVTDEAHHSTAKTYQTIYEALGAGTPNGPLHLGYTATPQRHDGQGLDGTFREIVFSRDIKQMVVDQWLVEPRGRVVKVEINLDKVRRNDSGDYSDAGLDDAMDDRIMEGIAKAWWEHARDRVTVAFAPSVRAAKALADAVNAIACGSLLAEEVDGGTPTEQRRDTLRRLQAGELRMVSNCGVLTEGFDAPNVRCILVARPTKSEPLYVQMVGRGLRLFPGKDDCLVLDVTGISAEHSLIVLPSLFGLESQDMEGRSVSEEAKVEAEAAARAAKAAGTAAERQRQQMRLAAASGVVDLLRRKRRWAWTEVQPGRVYSVALGGANGVSGMVVVRGLAPGQPGWWIAEVREYEGRTQVRGQALYRGDSDTAAEDAFGAAETWLAAQPLAARRLAGTGGWRARAAGEPATPAQLGALAKWRIEPPTGCTKAQASELLDAAISRARLRGA